MEATHGIAIHEATTLATKFINDTYMKYCLVVILLYVQNLMMIHRGVPRIIKEEHMYVLQ